MSNPTTPFSWQMPTSTDLVTDLPADFEVFGQAVATSMADLLGGTTGQILSKTTNADMDFTWIANDQGDITGVTAGVGITGGGTSGTVTVTNDMATTITAAGDIVVGTGSGTYDNLPIGTTAQVLTADTTVSPYKVKWATPAAGATGWTLLNAGGTALTAASSITISGIAAKQIMVLVSNASSTVASAAMIIRPNNLSTGIYNVFGNAVNAGATYSGSSIVDKRSQFNTTSLPIGDLPNAASGVLGAYVFIDKADQTGYKNYTLSGTGADNVGTSTGAVLLNTGGIIEMSAAITSITIVTTSGNFDGGTIYVYGGN